ncbi:hypothetical protein EV182_002764 [Spiromyces aspiralis]|uniref:Uncharacterized protein n=1 Tax=Spiromyces aspiralis TaxID=68401 RepID=A0ACC1HS74_9FUNG|nr:hypothetical protein EV182_002764 [Spiromyces aspiralis]
MLAGPKGCSFPLDTHGRRTTPLTSMYDRHLFGGAIFVSIPDDFEDVEQTAAISHHYSYFRQAHYNEASFTNVDTGECLSIELFELADDAEGEDGIRYRFDELASYNSAQPARLNAVGKLSDDEVPNLPITAQTYYAIGEQWLVDGVKSAETNTTARRRVDTIMALFRIYEAHLDIVVGLTVPVDSDAPHAEWTPTPAAEKSPSTLTDKAVTKLKAVLESFEILDVQKLFC